MASYQTVVMLSMKIRSIRDGNLVKQCTIKMAYVFGDDEVARKFEAVSLSFQTIARTVSDLTKHVS